MPGPDSLRERKKERTRKLISETARALFSEHGFEAVSVSTIAAEAEVSEATVYNYFQTKEDLVFEGMARFETEMIDAIRRRPAGESVVRAFGRFAIQGRGFLAAKNAGATDALLKVSRMIAGSPALLAREGQVLRNYAEALRAVIADDVGATEADIRPALVAHALIGLHASLITLVRKRVLQNCSRPELQRIAEEVRSEGEQAIDLLETGLGEYGVRHGMGT